MTDYDVELDAVGVAADAKTGKAETEKLRPKAPPPASKDTRGGGRKGGERSAKCPRWMFHRKGEWCKVCEKVGA